jgi:hypothetical protein
MLIDCWERIRFNRKIVGWFQWIVSKFKYSIVIGLVILAVGARMKSASESCFSNNLTQLFQLLESLYLRNGYS